MQARSWKRFNPAPSPLEGAVRHAQAQPDNAAAAAAIRFLSRRPPRGLEGARRRHPTDTHSSTKLRPASGPKARQLSLVRPPRVWPPPPRHSRAAPSRGARLFPSCSAMHRRITACLLLIESCLPFRLHVWLPLAPSAHPYLSRRFSSDVTPPSLFVFPPRILSRRLLA